MTSRVQSWLRSDVANVVQVVRYQRSRGAPEVAGLDVHAGLGRWSTQLTRRRAVVLARRYLLVGLGVALVPALVILVAGGSRPFWVLGALVLAPLAAVLALTHRTPEARVARVLDRALGLHEQLGTALELESEQMPQCGLAGMVVSEASTTLSESFATARVRARRAPAEWAWVAVGLCALGVVVAVPRHTGTVRGGGDGSALTSATPGGATGAQRPGAVTQTHTTPGSSRATTRPSAVQQVPLTGGAKAAYGQQASRTPGSRAPAFANGSATVQGQHTQPGLALSGGKGAAGSQGARSQPFAGTAGATATTGTGGATAAGKSGASRTSKATSGARGAHAGVTSTTAGPTAGASQASQQGRGRGGTPDGGGAGSGKAAAHAKLGLTPYGGAGTGTTALPLQATYTPTGAGHVSSKEGISQHSSGDGSSIGRTGHPGSAAAGSGGSGTDFSVIPPTSNPSASPDQDLVQNYFGTANQLSFKGW